MNMDRDTPLILPDYFLRYAECLKQLGFDPSELASQTQTRETSPGRSPFGVSVNQVSQILKACYDQLKIPYLGLALGNQMRLTVHGMAGVSDGAAHLRRLSAGGGTLLRASIPPLHNGIF